MKARLLGVLGLLVLVGSGIWWLLDAEDESLPEGAIAGASLTITVGEGAGGWPLTLPQTGVAVGGLLVVIALIWMALGARRNQPVEEQS